MKKWSISLLAIAAMSVAAIAFPAVSSAANAYCPAGQTGTPPYCTTPPLPPPPATCAAGQVGTFPNCVTPTATTKKVKVTRSKATVTLLVNARGTIKVSGRGVKAKTKKVAGGRVNVQILPTNAAKKTLRKKGKVTLHATITYTATGGSPIVKKFTVVLKSKKH